MANSKWNGNGNMVLSIFKNTMDRGDRGAEILTGCKERIKTRHHNQMVKRQSHGPSSSPQVTFCACQKWKKKKKSSTPNTLTFSSTLSLSSAGMKWEAGPLLFPLVPHTLLTGMCHYWSIVAYISSRLSGLRRSAAETISKRHMSNYRNADCIYCV